MPWNIPDSDVSGVPADQSAWYNTDTQILAAAFSGTGVVSGCGVTAQGSPDMTVAVAAGVILAAGVQVAVTSGNLTVGTADGTNPRIDLISASAAGVKTITAGTAAASPKPPGLPSGHVGLAFVDVPAADTTIGSAQITDKRVVLALAVGWVIGSNVYSPTQVVYSTTSSTWADVDPTNMVVSFIVPPSGVVKMRLVAWCDDTATTGTGLMWGLRESTTNLASVGGIVLRGGSDPQAMCVQEFLVTGTPGAARTLKWAFAKPSAGPSGTGRIIVGPGTDGGATTAGTFPAGVMTVMVA